VQSPIFLSTTQRLHQGDVYYCRYVLVLYKVTSYLNVLSLCNAIYIINHMNALALKRNYSMEPAVLLRLLN